MGYRDVRPDELTSLRETLDEHRAAARAAVVWLSDDQAGRQVLPDTAMTAGGVLKHLARMEDLWFLRKVAGDVRGEPWASHHFEEGWDFSSAAVDGVERLLGLYDRACERSRAVQAAHPRLDDLAGLPAWGDVLVNVRWVYLHMIGETAQHVGHLDLLTDALAAGAPNVTLLW